MSKFDSFKCDVCGKLREKDTNRWWAVRLTGPREGIYVTRFDYKIDDDKHACGEDCVLQLTQRWLATGAFDVQPVGATCSK